MCHSIIKVVLLFFVPALSSTLNAQNLAIDSLENVLAYSELTESQRLNIVDELSRKYSDLDLKTSLIFSNQTESLNFGNNESEKAFDVFRHQMLNAEKFATRESLIDISKRALTIANKTKDVRQLAESYSWLGQANLENGFEALAAENLIHALTLYEKLNDNNATANVYLMLGKLYVKREPDVAYQYYNKASKLIDGDTSLLITSLVNIGEALQNREAMEEAHAHFMRALALADINESDNISLILAKLGEHFYLKNDLERSGNYFDRAHLAAKLRDNIDAEILSVIGLAKIHYVQDHVDSMIAELNRALSMIPQNTYAIEMEINQLLVDGYMKMSRHEDAYKAQLRLMANRDSVYHRSESLKTAKIKTLYEIDNHIQKIGLLEQRNHLSGISISLFLVLSGLLTGLKFYYSHKKHNSNQRAILSLGHARQNFHEKLAMMEKSTLELQRETDRRNKTLTAFSLNLVHRSELLSDLMTMIEELKPGCDDKVAWKLHCLHQRAGALTQHRQIDWDNFNKYFIELNGHFFSDLNTSFPALTESELRFCALLSLNLDTSQIASVMEFSLQGTKVARHQLRKKMMATNADMPAFLHS